MKAVYAGERGSFAELAAREYFGAECRLEQVGLFDDVFVAVKKEQATYGIVPIENTRGGSVHQNYDLLLEHGISIVGELNLKIGQYLIANRGATIAKIRQVLSHPQALSQCRTYLGRHRRMQPVETVNTALAVKQIRDEGATDKAAIASMQAAIDFDMRVLAENIQDDKNNMTRFLVLSRRAHRSHPGDGPVKTSIVFSIKNIPGALFKALSVFSLRDIDLFKIESRPMFGQGFQYMFYLDFEGAATAKKQRNALSHLREMTTFFRLLGSYPVGRQVIPDYRKR